MWASSRKRKRKTAAIELSPDRRRVSYYLAPEFSFDPLKFRNVLTLPSNKFLETYGRDYSDHRDNNHQACNTIQLTRSTCEARTQSGPPPPLTCIIC